LLLLWLLMSSGMVIADDQVVALSAPRQDFWQALDASRLNLRSDAVLVTDEAGNLVYGKRTRERKSIASITKLMTAMVVLDSGLDLDTPIRIEEADRDRLRHSRSRLWIGRATLSRGDMLMVSLMSSDNRAAAALARTSFPGGTPAFVATMNRKARALGMTDTSFADSSGLDAANRSTAEDLARMIAAAAGYPFIREVTTLGEAEVRPYAGGGALVYRNTNPLVRNQKWQVELSKTGYINESGRCLVMQARIAGRRLRIVLLDSFGKLTPVGDSNRLRKWIEAGVGARAEG
jgi:D-alanyl-D-alanine endopeptidase (penicillin-binding protein 7)